MMDDLEGKDETRDSGGGYDNVEKVGRIWRIILSETGE